MPSPTQKSPFRYWLIETANTIIFAVIIAAIFRTIFFQPFWIPSGSMKSTLLIGDFLFVNKMAYGYSRYSCPFALCPFEGRIWAAAPKRGDVVVFRHPVLHKDYIKRVVGLPGDKIFMRDGRLFVNGSLATQGKVGIFSERYAKQGPYGSFPVCQNVTSIGEQCRKEAYRETLEGGVSYTVLNTRDGSYGDNTKIFTVPEKHYFFLGDNRDNSLDSRFPQRRGGVGFIHEKFLIGKAKYVAFSSAGWSLLFFWQWRGDRFFKKIE